MKDYLVTYEEGPNSWGAYVPDLPGCFAVGAHREDVEFLIPGAIAMHIEGLMKMASQFHLPPPTQRACRFRSSAKPAFISRSGNDRPSDER